MGFKSNKTVNTNNDELNPKQIKKQKKVSKFRDKLAMYDMIIANLLAGKSIIEPVQDLDNSQIHIGFSAISSRDELTKYFMITKFPDFLAPRLIDTIRSRCMEPGVKINFYFYCYPHKINWDSQEMKSRMGIWKKYTSETSDSIDIFAYRNQRGEALARKRIILSTKYLNEAELEHKRSFIRSIFVITISAKRDDESLANMAESIMKMKSLASNSDMRINELSINMLDWVRALSPFSLRSIKEVDNKLSRKVVTDDILANFNSYSQGRVGVTGVCLGSDVLNGGPVLRKFKEDPTAADNWLISAETGGGKSYWLKTLLTFLMADGFVACVMDYEGDEYLPLAYFLRESNPEDVKIVSMGKGSTIYFDPCEIPDLTGDPDVDCDLKETAIGFITATFRILVKGADEDFTRPEEKVLSLAIQRMYDTVGVTDDPKTWKRSKGLRLSDIYYEIKEMVDSKELVDNDADNIKHKAAITIADATSICFEPGEAKSHMFKNPMSANELYKAKFIVFSFGMKGADKSSIDPIILALKQLSVAYVNIQISNYCKYVRKCFNIKVWEEFQRYGDAKGSASVITNSITGGRKRGDVNFIITNDLAAMIDDNNPLTSTLRQNIQNYAIGKIKDKKTRQDFCAKFDLHEIKSALDQIAKAHSTIKKGKQKISGANSRYKHSFCVVLDDGTKAVVKAKLPKALAESKLFKTGVEVEEEKDKE